MSLVMRKNIYNCFFGTWEDVTKRANFNSMVVVFHFLSFRSLRGSYNLFTSFFNYGILLGRFRIGWDCQLEYLNLSGTMYYVL